MWPKLTNIEPNIAAKIKSYGDSHEASKLNAWIRVFSGATTSANNGLIMESNTDFGLFRAAGETTKVIYGDLQSSGILGVDWEGKAVETGLGRRLRPSPVITSFSVKEGKDQISRQATLEIKAFSLEQMEKIQTYFLEPGYQLYIEWGWNTPNGVRNITKATGDLKGIVKNISDKSLNWNDLSNTRKSSDGEFDCFLGFIVGGNVSGDTENFNISVNLRGAPSLPTYMQSYQGAVQLDPSGSVAESRKVKKLFGPTEYEAIGDADNIKSLRRFARMFNDLPAFRQTTDIYELHKKAQWYQFINFDDVVKKQVNEAISPAWYQADNVEFTIGTGTKVPISREKLFSEKRYIRMDLAVAILNKIGSIDAYKIGDKEVTFQINIDNVVIGGFPCMFSTKADKLIIPGSLPDFFQYYLQSEDIEQLPGGLGGCKLKVNGIEKDYRAGGADGLFPFRWAEELNKFGYREDSSYWGYLRYLFVNFEMFTSKIEQKNKNIREILLDILNEMSSAVNSFWNFQVVEGNYEAPTKTDGITTEYSSIKEGDIILTVIDENFIGKNPNDSPVFFRHVGSGSVFLEANIDISIPAEMTNKIVMTRLGNSINPDEPIVSTESAFFESKNDLFLEETAKNTNNEGDSGVAEKSEVELVKEELDSIGIIEKKEFDFIDRAGNVYYTTTYYKIDSGGKQVEVKSDDPSVKKYQETSKRLEEAQKKELDRKSQNMTAYLEKLTVLPISKHASIGYKSKELTTETVLKKEDEKGELQLKESFYIYTFDDTEYFDRLRIDGFAKKGNFNLSHPLPIKYSFKILGNSGIRRGDTFSILGIPAKYSRRGIFQVTEIEHSFEGNKWFTTITGDYRQQQ